MKKLPERIFDAVAACQQRAKQYGIAARYAEQCDGNQIIYFTQDSKLTEIKACEKCVFREG